MDNPAQLQVFILLWIFSWQLYYSPKLHVYMEEGEERRDSSYQKQYYGDNYLNKDFLIPNSVI